MKRCSIVFKYILIIIIPVPSSYITSPPSFTCPLNTRIYEPPSPPPTSVSKFFSGYVLELNDEPCQAYQLQTKHLVFIFIFTSILATSTIYIFISCVEYFFSYISYIYICIYIFPSLRLIF